MGFERIPSADYISQNEAHWFALQLNLRDKDLLMQLDKRLESATGGYPAISIQDLTDFVKKALIHFDSLEQQVHILETAQMILQLTISSLEEEIPSAPMLRKYLLESMEDMAADRMSEKELFRIFSLPILKKLVPMKW